ncbi:hypothetical protein DVK85_01510 [Flavobacterium arcticum]|uniref:Uncharacterized protein n=1 Tax=Flavobacterium arcticum TaxID=1784713 RepID=A0A345H8R9_9FLAO|nr:hypothetical protein [Flavobacterium arcticum]AXG72979.1 hypothetical protein DVK85_01510 [Flavobacterium arcticum]KAF2510357.1 hypothetical protein E0W72_07695 [Flavobacterium arcticum]
MKLFKTTNVNLLKNFIISKKVLFLLTLALFVIDFSLSKPIYVNVLDMPELGVPIAAVFAFIISLLPKVTAKLLAKKQYILSVIAILFGIGLMAFIYVGNTN